MTYPPSQSLLYVPIRSPRANSGLIPTVTNRLSEGETGCKQGLQNLEPRFESGWRLSRSLWDRGLSGPPRTTKDQVRANSELMVSSGPGAFCVGCGKRYPQASLKRLPRAYLGVSLDLCARCWPKAVR